MPRLKRIHIANKPEYFTFAFTLVYTPSVVSGPKIISNLKYFALQKGHKQEKVKEFGSVLLGIIRHKMTK